MHKSHHFPGFLIAIEGIDGAGKTTQSQHIQSILQERGNTVIRTKEPTTGHWGQVLRDSANTGRLSKEDEVEHFLRDRKEHVDTVIIPELKLGNVVIVDRYFFSNMAYQGARGMDPLKIMELNEAFAPEPDMLVLLDIDPQNGLDRIRMRGDRANHFEKTSTLRKAREIFLGIKKPYLIVVDALQETGVISKAIIYEFNIRYTNQIGFSDMSPEEKLNATLKMMGGKPI